MPVSCLASFLFSGEISDMDLLRGNLRSIYFKYLGAAFGSALISSIYTLVDMAMVGQYQGPSGTAALAVMAPIWNLIFSLGLLTGIGGSVLFSAARGAGEQERSNEFFSVALWSSVALSAAAWIVVLLWEVPMLRLFGGSEELLPLAQEYLVPIKFVIPLFPLNQMLAAFLRNDGSPALATGAVLAGGIFNIFGDFVFVFPMDMGIFGAGLATAIGAAITFVAMLTHFFSKRNTLRLVRPSQPWTKLRQVLVSGFSTFLSDVAMGILTMLFNRQIMAYLGTDALAVYGVIVSVSTFVQCCAYSVGQAAQPILSVNFGAGQGMRIRKALNYSLWSAAFFGPCLDWADHGRSQPVHPYLYVSDQRDSVHRSGHHPLLCSILLAASLQYLFHLLFPGPVETSRLLPHLDLPGDRGQRCAYLPAPLGRRRCHLVRHAHHRGGSCGSCGGSSSSAIPNRCLFLPQIDRTPHFLRQKRRQHRPLLPFQGRNQPKNWTLAAQTK